MIRAMLLTVLLAPAVQAGGDDPTYLVTLNVTELG